jgi:hypothetical protein
MWNFSMVSKPLCAPLKLFSPCCVGEFKQLKFECSNWVVQFVTKIHQLVGVLCEGL